MTALQGWIVIGLLVLIMLGIVAIGAEIEFLAVPMAYGRAIRDRGPQKIRMRQVKREAEEDWGR
jgi:hypothetical protein